MFVQRGPCRRSIRRRRRTPVGQHLAPTNVNSGTSGCDGGLAHPLATVGCLDQFRDEGVQLSRAVGLSRDVGRLQVCFGPLLEVVRQADARPIEELSRKVSAAFLASRRSLTTPSPTTFCQSAIVEIACVTSLQLC
eukprot:7406210-Pyramimonas_sp.AAC.1